MRFLSAQRYGGQTGSARDAGCLQQDRLNRDTGTNKKDEDVEEHVFAVLEGLGSTTY